MAIERKKGWRVRRLERRANAERAVIDGSVYHISAKLEEASRNITSLRRKVSAASKETLARHDAGESLEVTTALLEEVELIESQLSLEENLMGMFARLKTMLSKLLIFIDALIRLEDYKYVIKAVPEKKIPEYVKASRIEDITVIVELTAELLAKMEKRFTMVSKARNELDDKTARIKGVASQMRSEVEMSDREKRDAIEALRKRTEQREASHAVPVPPQMTETEAAPRPTNKA